MILNQLEENTAKIESSVNNDETIFISYSWNDKELVDAIDDIFNTHGITITRDIRDLEYRQSIKEFMSKIRETDFTIIILVIHISSLLTVCMKS